MPTNKGTIYIIVVTIAFLASLCVTTTCWLAYIGKDAPQAFSLLTGGLLGSLTGMLVKTSPTQTTTSVAVQDQPTVVPADDPNKPKV